MHTPAQAPAGLVVVLLAYAMLVGGFLTFASLPLAMAALAACVVFILAGAVTAWRTHSLAAHTWAGIALLSAPILSAIANPDLSDPWSVPLFFAGGLGVMQLTHRLGGPRLLDGLYRAAWIWLALWPVPFILGWPVSENITAIWGMVGVLVVLVKGKPWGYALPFAASLLVLGSRGAVLGLLVGLAVYLRPRVTPGRMALALIVGLALFAYRPNTALYRLSYWRQAVAAWQQHDLAFGLGPTGIAQRAVILQPDGSSDQPHAHNLAVQFLAEFGLYGLAMLALAALLVKRRSVPHGWQAAMLAGLLALCILDYPFACVGPLWVFCAIAGTL